MDSIGHSVVVPNVVVLFLSVFGRYGSGAIVSMDRLYTVHPKGGDKS